MSRKGSSLETRSRLVVPGAVGGNWEFAEGHRNLWGDANDLNVDYGDIYTTL